MALTTTKIFTNTIENIAKEKQITHLDAILYYCEKEGVEPESVSSLISKGLKEKIEARNHADGLVDSTEKALKEHGDKISAEEKSKIETGINGLKEALKGEDVEAIKKKTGELTEASMKLGEAVYKDMQEQAKETAQDGPKKETKKKDDKDIKENVVDAEFEDVTPVDKPGE